MVSPKDSGALKLTNYPNGTLACTESSLALTSTLSARRNKKIRITQANIKLLDIFRAFYRSLRCAGSLIIGNNSKEITAHQELLPQAKKYMAKVQEATIAIDEMDSLST
jgi:hypothetical protein